MSGASRWLAAQATGPFAGLVNAQSQCHHNPPQLCFPEMFTKKAHAHNYLLLKGFPIGAFHEPMDAMGPHYTEITLQRSKWI